MEVETQKCSRPLRLSPLKNNFSELNTLWDRDEEVTFEDVLGGTLHCDEIMINPQGFVDYVCKTSYRIDWTSNPDCH